MARPTLTLLLASAFGSAAQLLFYREGPGLNVAVATILSLALAWVIRTSPPLRADLWMPVFAVSFAASVAVRTDTSVIVFDLIAAITLVLATTASLRGVAVSRLGSGDLAAEALRTATGALWRAAPALRSGSEPLARSVPRLGHVLPYLAGVALAVPFLLMFAALFRSADPVFERAWNDFLDVAGWWQRLGDARGRALLGLVAGWIAAGALAGRGGSRSVGPGPHVGSDVAAGALSSVAALFAVFVYIQIAYLFRGSDTMAAASMSYSEYARRGFFELLVCAALVSAMLFAADLLVDRSPLAYRASALTVLTLTSVIVASAAYRLDLYQRAYGWSELRLYALAAIAAVACGVGVLAWSIVARRMTYAIQPVVLTTFAVALAVNVLGPSAYVARANASRFLDGPSAERGALDVWYLVSLGHGALPDIVALREKLPEPERRCLDFALSQRYRFEDPDRAPSLQSWNVDRERARAALGSVRSALAEVDPRDPSVCSGVFR